MHTIFGILYRPDRKDFCGGVDWSEEVGQPWKEDAPEAETGKIEKSTLDPSVCT